MYIAALLLLALAIRPDPVINDAAIESAILSIETPSTCRKQAGAIAIAVKQTDWLVMLAKLSPVHRRSF